MRGSYEWARTRKKYGRAKKKVDCSEGRTRDTTGNLALTAGCSRLAAGQAAGRAHAHASTRRDLCL